MGGAGCLPFVARGAGIGGGVSAIVTEYIGFLVREWVEKKTGGSVIGYGQIGCDYWLVGMDVEDGGGMAFAYVVRQAGSMRLRFMMDRKPIEILVADPSEGLRSSFREALEPQGWGVQTAESGREAIDVIRRQPIHVVVMDVRLPDYSGYEIYHAIKDIRDVFLPCIFTALEMSARSLQDAMSEEAITILPKPVDMQRLVHAIGWSIERYYARPEQRPHRPGHRVRF